MVRPRCCCEGCGGEQEGLLESGPPQDCRSIQAAKTSSEQRLAEGEGEAAVRGAGACCVPTCSLSGEHRTMVCARPSACSLYVRGAPVAHPRSQMPPVLSLLFAGGCACARRAAQGEAAAGSSSVKVVEQPGGTATHFLCRLSQCARTCGPGLLSWRTQHRRRCHDYCTDWPLMRNTGRPVPQQHYCCCRVAHHPLAIIHHAF